MEHAYSPESEREFAISIQPSARDDVRCVSSDDPRAVLVAWAGPDLTLDMGGWLDTDRDAFIVAVRDELAYGLSCSASEAEDVRLSVSYSEIVRTLIAETIDEIQNRNLTCDLEIAQVLESWGSSCAGSDRGVSTTPEQRDAAASAVREHLEERRWKVSNGRGHLGRTASSDLARVYVDR